MTRLAIENIGSSDTKQLLAPVLCGQLATGY